MFKSTVFSEENFGKIIEFAPIGIVIVDKTYQWLLVNQRFCEIVGYEKQELANMTFLDITHPDDRDNNVKLYERMRAGEYNEYGYEKRYVRKDGQVIWVRLIVSAGREGGEYSHLVALIEDINETKHYQQNLINKNEELDRLFYKVSHDLKAPVTTLQGICNLLHLEYPHLRTQPIFTHLDSVVNQLTLQNMALLRLAEIYQHPLAAKDIHLEKLVDQALRETVGDFDVSKKDLDINVKADYFLLMTILKILLNNSLTHSNGKKLSVLIVGEQQANRTSIFISDNGPGISPEHLPKIFQMFYKAADNSKGSGLGLYTARVAAEKMNAELTAEAVLEKGARFVLKWNH